MDRLDIQVWSTTGLAIHPYRVLRGWRSDHGGVKPVRFANKSRDYDHQAEMDRCIVEQETFVAGQRQRTPSVLARKLKARRGG